MSVDIDSIKRKLLIKYPTFGSIIANIEFEETDEIKTAATDGKTVGYNSKFINELSEKEQVFVFAHELCHIAFKHIERRDGKNNLIWNIATDAVINALLKKDGMSLVENVVYIPEAINCDAEQMYNNLLNESVDTAPLHASHDLWGKTIKKDITEPSELDGVLQRFAEKGETEIFKKNANERKKNLQQFSESLAYQAGMKSNSKERKLENIGIAQPLIDWRRLLKQAVKSNEEWSIKNTRTRDGFFRHRLEETPISETEIVLDTSGSVSEKLLKNFLKECKNIVSTSKVKVGCFNTKFHGFTDLRRVEDIDNMTFQIGGGTDFNVAVNAFSDRVSNKIIFTDGQAPMPTKEIKNLIWVVYGKENIRTKGGKVINIKGEQLRKLNQSIFRNVKTR